MFVKAGRLAAWLAILITIGFCTRLTAAAQPVSAEKANQAATLRSPDPDGGVALWGLRPAQVGEEAGQHFVRLNNTDPGRNADFGTVVALDPSWRRVVVTANVRVSDLKTGKETYHDARIAYHFLNAEGQRVGPWPAVSAFKKDTDGWTEAQSIALVPLEAVAINLRPSLIRATGTFDIADLQVTGSERRFSEDVKSFGEATAAGTFSTPSPAAAAAVWNLNLEDKHLSLNEEDGRSFVRFAQTDPDQTVKFSRRFELEPDWEQVTFSALVRLPELDRGTRKGDPRIRVEFLSAAGRPVQGTASPATRFYSAQDWRKLERRHPVPQQAELVEVTFEFYQCVGSMDLAELRLDGGSIPPRDAELPRGVALRWGDEPVEKLSETRGRIVLNGIWAFRPAEGPAGQVGPKGYLRVPGSWSIADDWREPLRNIDWFVARGEGRIWQGDAINNVTRAWYERQVRIPGHWRDRQIILHVDRLSTDAIVFIGDKRLGEVHWPGGEVVLDEAVTPGKEATLRILVAATASEEAAVHLMDADAAVISAPTVRNRGLIGDVWIESRPRGMHISGVYVKPSVQNGALVVDVDVDQAAAGSAVSLQAVVKDGDGREVKRFAGEHRLGQAVQQTVTLRAPWQDAQLWEPEHPHLYTLHVELAGDGVRDQYVERFGFREFRIEGRQFLLNEKPFRIRPVNIRGGYGIRELDKRQMTALTDAAFNALQIRNTLERGTIDHDRLLAELADEMGVPLLYPALTVGTHVRWQQQGTEEQYQAWESLMVREWKRIRNHPSIIILYSTPNRFGHVDDQNPLRIGNTANRPMGDPVFVERIRPAQRVLETIKRYETTRPVTVHHGMMGDLDTTNTYLNLIPLQERENWLSDWAEHGDQPFMAVEFGTPWFSTLMRGRIDPNASRATEPLMTEYAAVYFGDSVYSNEEAEYRAQIALSHRGEQRYGWMAGPVTEQSSANLRLQELFVRNTWRSWRTWGISGGMVPWDLAFGWEIAPTPPRAIELPTHQPGRLGIQLPEVAFNSLQPGMRRWLHASITKSGETLVEVNSATLAWIAGPEERFTDKQHHYASEQGLRKSAVLINDTRQVQPFSASWEVLSASGQSLARGQSSGRIDVGQTLFLPIEAELPATQKRVDGRLILSARIGDHEHADEFTFRIYPPTPKQALPKMVMVFDHRAETRNMIENLGIATRHWDGSASSDLLIIGRHALSDGAAAPGSIEAFVRAGGRVVLFAQDPMWLEKHGGYRVSRHVSRRFWPVHTQAAHPLVAGLDADDFRDWNGAGTLLSPTARTELDDFTDRREGWRWGNDGSVSSAAIEKPHHSGWRPVLEGEFDLAYSPLMELQHGEGLAVWCLLDLEDRTLADPVAEQMLQRVLHYATTVELPRRPARTMYVGDKETQAWLRSMGLVFETGIVPAGDALIVLGPGAATDDEMLKSALLQGAHILLLGWDAGKMPFGFEAARKPFASPDALPDWPEARGLSHSDLRLRTDVEVPILSAAAGEIAAGGILGRRSEGQGVVIALQLHPKWYSADERTYLRFSRWRTTRAAAQLLANMGASFAGDAASLSFAPRLVARQSLAGHARAAVVQGFAAPARFEDRVVDKGISDKARQLVAADVDDSQWLAAPVPQQWESYGGEWANMDGEAVFRFHIDIPDHWRGHDLLISLGNIHSTDITFFNGRQIGQTGTETRQWWRHPRRYTVPADQVKIGRNVLAVRIFNDWHEGGFMGNPDQMYIEAQLPDEIGLYHADYRADFQFGDSPFRYKRW
jgi:beta-galactosidase